MAKNPDNESESKIESTSSFWKRTKDAATSDACRTAGKVVLGTAATGAAVFGAGAAWQAGKNLGSRFFRRNG